MEFQNDLIAQFKIFPWKSRVEKLLELKKIFMMKKRSGKFQF